MTVTTAYLLAALNGTAFYVLGSCLAVLALVVTAIGLRSSEKFPSRAATRAAVALFAVLVVATAYFAIAYSEDEQVHREAELAAEEAEEGATELPAGGEVPAPDAAPAEGAPAPPVSGPGGTIELTADPTDLAYDTAEIASKPGEVTIDFDNPAQIAHDVTIEQGGEELAKTDLVTMEETSLSVDLAAGQYVFYCSVPGHREAGMQGTLSVK